MTKKKLLDLIYKYKKFIKKDYYLQGTRNEISSSLDVSSIGLDGSFLFDFKNYQSEYSNINNTSISTFFINRSDSSESDNDSKSSGSVRKKIEVKPIDVLNELETIPTPWTLSNLDDKIEVLEYKRDLITQKYSRREVEAMIERLHNRKKWDKHRIFFEGFQNTTDEKIEKLLNKYDLVMKTSDLFVPEFPDIAISIMKSYTDEVMSICKKKPVFYVIAEPDKFRKAYEKRDPILLVQSPFGFYWQILGAWDKEMILLSEL
jgi:hypothetical protein